jgi:hypothetical protein
VSSDDIESGRDAAALAARLTSWRMLTEPKKQRRPPRGKVLTFRPQDNTPRDTLTKHPSNTEDQDEKQ